MSDVTAVSLFSGCGGSDLGITKSGIKVIFANDIQDYAKIVYEANLPKTEYIVKDITKITDFPDANLLCGCYPCTGYSQGGARDTERNINFLYRQFDRALRAIRPQVFIVENVPGMARGMNQKLLRNQITRYRLAGYRVKWGILNAADYGIPQKRKRIFIVGIQSKLKIEYRFPEPTHGEGCANPYKTLRDTIWNMPRWPKGEFWEDDFHWYYLSRDRRKSWDEPSNTILSNPRHMPLHPMSPKLKKMGEDKWQFSHRQSRPRRLSYREAAHLQGFINWEFPNEEANLSKKYAVIGNAVPPLMFEQMVRNIPEEAFHG